MRRIVLVGVAALALACEPAVAEAAVPGPPEEVGTGNVLVLLRSARASAAAVRAVDASAARLGARSAGLSVPEIGLATLRPPAGVGLEAFAAELRALPGVASVQIEHRLVPRFVPNDPALSASAAATGVEEWELAREGFYSAWNITHGDGALVGVIDTGADASHPDLVNKIAGAVDQQSPSDATGTARTDEVGHGTHVSSLACAGTNDGIGMAGAGFDCKLLIEKSDFSDSSIAASIVDAANRHVDAINMSFGPTNCTDEPAPDSEVRALEYAAAKKVVLVAAAADQACTRAGRPSERPAARGQRPRHQQGTRPQRDGRGLRRGPGEFCRLRERDLASRVRREQPRCGHAGVVLAGAGATGRLSAVSYSARHSRAGRCAERRWGAPTTPTFRGPRWRRRRSPPLRR